MSFKVCEKPCDTCIYRKDLHFDIKVLEAQVSDGYGGFKTHRICHHSEDVCCRGFWNAHKNQFALGQIAQRLDMVQFVPVNNDITFGEDVEDGEIRD